MGILANHKIKIIFSLAGTSVIGAGVSIPYLTSNNSVEQEINHQSLKHPQHEKAVYAPKQISTPIEEPKESTSSKLAGLKNQKVQLLNNVENQISYYKNMVKGINDVNKLEEELNKCFSKEEVSGNITNDEKQKLKTSYELVKADIKKYEELQKQISSGELNEKESYADKDNTSEERYNDFKSKFDAVDKEYNDTVNKKSGENLYSSFSNIKSKLDLTNSQCSLKDVIKMNDAIGERNSQENSR